MIHYPKYKIVLHYRPYFCRHLSFLFIVFHLILVQITFNVYWYILSRPSVFSLYQVGDGTQVRAVPMFQLIRGLEGHHMTGVACGWAHSIALSQSGQVWVWGSNSHGQLGLPQDEVSLHPDALLYSYI